MRKLQYRGKENFLFWHGNLEKVEIIYSSPLSEEHYEIESMVETKKQKIFIAVEQGFICRYLLRTDIFKILKNSGVGIVILTPNSDEKYFAEEFNGENVFIEHYRCEDYSKYLSQSKLQKFLRAVRLYTTNRNYHINSPSYWYNYHKKNRFNGTMGKKIYNCLFDFLVYMLGRFKIVRKVVILLESILFTGDFHRALFLKYKPALLLVTSLGTAGSNDCYIMREARKHGTKVVSIILSWDYPSTKGMAGAIADHVVAWTETMKQELIQYHDINPKSIFVGGVAHYDVYFRDEVLKEREGLFKQFGMESNRKLIFLCLMSPTQFSWNPKLIETMGRAISDGMFAYPSQLLVRWHPIYFRIENGKLKFQKDIDELMSVKDKYPHVYYDIPEILSNKMSFDMPSSEMVKVGSILKHADVILCFFSSMMVEASIFDTPIVNMALFSKNNIPNEVIVNHNHIKRILNTDGVRVAYNERELIDCINLYLNAPETDRYGRQVIKDRETGPFQGKAGECIGRHILNLLDA